MLKADNNVGKIKKNKKKRLKKWLLILIIIVIILRLFLFNGNKLKTVNLLKEVELLREEKEPFVIILTDSNSQIINDIHIINLKPFHFLSNHILHVVQFSY